MLAEPNFNFIECLVLVLNLNMYFLCFFSLYMYYYSVKLKYLPQSLTLQYMLHDYDKTHSLVPHLYVAVYVYMCVAAYIDNHTLYLVRRQLCLLLFTPL